MWTTRSVARSLSPSGTEALKVCDIYHAINPATFAPPDQTRGDKFYALAAPRYILCNICVYVVKYLTKTPKAPYIDKTIYTILCA